MRNYPTLKKSSLVNNNKTHINFGINSSNCISFQKDPVISIQSSLGNHVISGLLMGSSSLSPTNDILQRQTYSDDGMLQDLPPASGCECDCESYAREVARFYADRHLVYPSWTGGPRRPMPLDIYWWHCHHFNRTPGSCTWTAIVVFENRVTKTKYSVFVQLVNSSKFHVGTHSKSFPLCTYNFECDSSGSHTRLNLTEIICRDRTIFREL